MARADKHAASVRTALRAALPWAVGLALLVLVLRAGIKAAEPREFIALVDHARPQWVLYALGLQAATYFAQGETWRCVLRAAGCRVRRAQTYALSLAKLFVDQAVPSAGLTGSVLVVRALQRAGLPRSVVLATVLTDTAAYYCAYLACLALAVAHAVARGLATLPLLGLAGAFAVFSGLVIAGVFYVADPRVPGLRRWLSRVRVVREALELIGDADTRLVRNRRVFVRATGWQLSIIALDAGSLWALLGAVGISASPADVFASFLISTLLRRATGVVPGGLGTFEAAAVYTLTRAGIPVSAALAATLLFRGLGFWLPMIPGLVFARAARGAGRRVDKHVTGTLLRG